MEIISDINTNITTLGHQNGFKTIPVSEKIQEDILSPTLFNLVIDEIITTLKSLQIEDRMSGRVRCSTYSRER